jgi:beta-mannosidase
MTYDLGELEWTLAGWTPYVWRQQRSIEAGVSNNAEVSGVSARVPGSVQGALLEAGIIPDWNVALNARLSEWVENRHWIYTARLPDGWLSGRHTRLLALGLDYRGWILLNGREIGTFSGSLNPHVLDLTPHLRPTDNTLQFVFDTPPRWLGQIGYTSRMTEWKERFNYFWDWTARLVQVGIWDSVLLETTDGQEIGDVECRATADADSDRGSLYLRADVRGERGDRIKIVLGRGESVIREAQVGRPELQGGMTWAELPIERWWPNGSGDQPLYDLDLELLDECGHHLDSRALRVGFKSLTWEPCEGAPSGADPWLCTVNGQPVFLQGVNWTPIRPNFADVPDAQYRALLERYRDMGCNLLRVWGGAFLEKSVFYHLCDELGLMVWQEFPLSSSGLDNWPPDDPDSLKAMEHIARSYIERRRHHVSLALWCGGNELTALNHRPVDAGHPMMNRLRRVVERLDPDHRFLPTSPSGPRFESTEAEFGRGLHWDVHGPWHVTGNVEGEWRRYWEANDALFHSEVGVSGASSVDLIRAYKGDLPEVPGTAANPLWRRTSWWIDWPDFVRERGRDPDSLEEYVAWSQERQRKALQIAVEATKQRFPRCGGILVWMGHDSFPCTANLSIIDFWGRPKPAAESVGEVFRKPIMVREGADR